MRPMDWQSLLDHSFFFIADVFFLILDLWAVRIVRKTRWQFHQNWLVAFLFEDVLALLYRTIWNAHYFTGVHLPQAVYTFAKYCLYTANVVGIGGTVVLCQTLKRMVNEGGREPANSTGEPGVWPPPPVQPDVEQSRKAIRHGSQPGKEKR